MTDGKIPINSDYIKSLAAKYFGLDPSAITGLYENLDDGGHVTGITVECSLTTGRDYQGFFMRNPVAKTYQRQTK